MNRKCLVGLVVASVAIACGGMLNAGQSGLRESPIVLARGGVCLILEHAREKNGQTPLILLVGGAEISGWLDPSGYVRDGLESGNGAFGNACFQIDLAAGVLRSGGDEIVLNKVFHSVRRTRIMIAAGQLPVSLVWGVGEVPGELRCGQLSFPVAIALETGAEGRQYVRFTGNQVRCQLPFLWDEAAQVIRPYEGRARSPIKTGATETIPASEREALIRIYNETGGDNWIINSNWRDPNDPSQFNAPGTEWCWWGITVTDGHVTNLDLAWNNLTGMIPAAIADLTYLTGLGLWWNDLYGPIPDALARLTKLQAFTAECDRLSGTIPKWLTTLPDLRMVRFNYNELEGWIPADIGRLKKLEIFFVNDNYLEGTIPSGTYGIGGCSSLLRFALSNNQFYGSLPSQIGNLKTLRRLCLDGNRFTGSIPTAIGNLTGLVEFLDLSGNLFSGNIPSSLGNLRQLEYCYLKNNALKGSIPSAILNMQCVYEFFIDYNGLYTSNSSLIAFLDAKNPGWADTQTIAPTNMKATSPSAGTAVVSWTPIRYTSDSGGYQVYRSRDNFNWTYCGQTVDKLAASYTVTGLTRGVRYYFKARTVTEEHLPQKNRLESAYGSTVSVIIR